MKAEFNNATTVITKAVRRSGPVGRIYLPAEYIGKTVFVVVVDESKE